MEPPSARSVGASRPPSSSSSKTSCIWDTGSRRAVGESGSWRPNTQSLEFGHDPAGIGGSGGNRPHRDQRQRLRGRQTHSVWGVDPQQVVGGHVQVMVPMGGGKHTHLPTREASTRSKPQEKMSVFQVQGESRFTCLSSSTAPTCSSSTLSSRRRRCTVPSISPDHKQSGGGMCLRISVVFLIVCLERKHLSTPVLSEVNQQVKSGRLCCYSEPLELWSHSVRLINGAV